MSQMGTPPHTRFARNGHRPPLHPARVVFPIVLVLHAAAARAQDDGSTRGQDARPRVEISGAIVTSAIHDFHQVDPAWFDVLRPSKLPALDDEFGRDGRQWFSIRPTRVTVRPVVPTSLGEIRGVVEWDLVGMGPSAGRTAFHPTRAYAELGRFGAGQFDSPFMDMDVFPDILEYWGPAGIVFFRNIQFRYMPVRGDSRVTIALERPGASHDPDDNDDDRIEQRNLVERFPWPDLSAEGRLGGSRGYVELSGVLRAIYWDDLLRTDSTDLGGGALGWGLSLSSTLELSERGRLKLQATRGEAIQNYLDAPFDIGFEHDPDNGTRPLRGVALPVFSMLAFYEHDWSEKISTTLGYSRIDVENSNAQSPRAFRAGQYALVNLLYDPVDHLAFGGELQWGRRTNAFDDFEVDDLRLQLTARFDFAVHLGIDVTDDQGR